MAGIVKLSALQKKIMLIIYLISFPVALFAYGMGFRDIVVALSGVYLLAALSVSESNGELASIFLLSLVEALSEMVNVGAGNWSYTPTGGFVNKQEILMISYAWGCFMWTAYNLAKLTMKRKNLLLEVGGVMGLLVVFSLTQPKFYLDPSTLLILIISLAPWYFFYRISNNFEKAFLLFAAALGFYNEMSGILSNVWFWESFNGTNILTLVGGGIGYSIPMWLTLKAGSLIGSAKIKYE